MSEPIRDPYAPDSRASKPPTTSGAAIGSVLAALTCPALGGLVGVALGIVARSEIARSGGTLTGKGFATAGVVLGALNSLGSVGAFVAAMMYASTPTAPPPAPRTPVFAPGPAFAPAPLPAPVASTARPPRGAMTRDDGIIETTVGSVVLVDVGTAERSLERVIDLERSKAEAGGKRLIVWLVWHDCEPCNGVAAALPDTAMQKALASTRLLRVDVHEFATELARLGLPTASVPGFALVGANNRAADFVHGGEWDEDIARNIAPVLDRFVKGTYAKRRHPWRAGPLADETPL